MGNVFDPDSVFEFNAEIQAGNPLGYPGFDDKLAAARKKTGRKSACVTFEAKIDGIKLVSAVLYSAFRGGSVGAAEGEKFILALSRARQRHFPFLAYVHGTAGIRIQESLNGLIQMPRVTMKDSKLAGAFHQGDAAVCQGCHHNSPAGKTPPRCGNCHPAAEIPGQSRPALKAAYHARRNLLQQTSGQYGRGSQSPAGGYARGKILRGNAVPRRGPRPVVGDHPEDLQIPHPYLA